MSRKVDWSQHMAFPKVYADFQNLDDENRLRLTCAGTRDDLAQAGIELREGLALLFYTDDADEHGRPDELRVEGVVHYDEVGQCWVAVVDWNALRHASEEENTNGAQPTQPQTDASSPERRRTG
jgi:hypothetical protein